MPARPCRAVRMASLTASRTASHGILARRLSATTAAAVVSIPPVRITGIVLWPALLLNVYPPSLRRNADSQLAARSLAGSLARSTRAPHAALRADTEASGWRTRRASTGRAPACRAASPTAMSAAGSGAAPRRSSRRRRTPHQFRNGESVAQLLRTREEEASGGARTGARAGAGGRPRAGAGLGLCL